MDVRLISLSSIIILCFFLTILPPSYCDEDDNDPFVVCNRTYTCGRVNIPYPFWGGSRPESCGHQDHELSCINNIYEYPVLRFEALEFGVLNINPSNRSFTMARLDLLWAGPCPPNLLSTTLDFNLFDYAQNVQNVTLFYRCPPQDNYNIPFSNRFNCSPESVTDGKFNAYIVDKSPLSGQLQQLMGKCDNIKVPILNSSAIALVEDPQGGAGAVRLAMNQGFEVEYSIELATLCRPCEASDGVCGSNSTQRFLCFCRDQVQSLTTCPLKPVAGKTNLGLKIGIESPTFTAQSRPTTNANGF